MTITPYSISESTKISDAYLKNVVNEGAKGNGILKRGGEWLGKKVGRWVNRGADDAAKAATSGADNVAAKAATSGADNVAAKAATSGADNVAVGAGEVTPNGRKILNLVKKVPGVKTAIEHPIATTVAADTLTKPYNYATNTDPNSFNNVVGAVARNNGQINGKDVPENMKYNVLSYGDMMALSDKPWLRWTGSLLKSLPIVSNIDRAIANGKNDASVLKVIASGLPIIGNFVSPETQTRNTSDVKNVVTAWDSLSKDEQEKATTVMMSGIQKYNGLPPEQQKQYRKEISKIHDDFSKLTPEQRAGIANAADRMVNMYRSLPYGQSMFNMFGGGSGKPLDTTPTTNGNINIEDITEF